MVAFEVAEALVVLAVSEAVGLVEAGNGEIKLKKPKFPSVFLV
ncbi:MAG: hypothetical protein ACI8ZO_000572 [Flavobacteriales bacterium]